MATAWNTVDTTFPVDEAAAGSKKTKGARGADKTAAKVTRAEKAAAARALKAAEKAEKKAAAAAEGRKRKGRESVDASSTDAGDVGAVRLGDGPVKKARTGGRVSKAAARSESGDEMAAVPAGRPGRPPRPLPAEFEEATNARALYEHALAMLDHPPVGEHEVPSEPCKQKKPAGPDLWRGVSGCGAWGLGGKNIAVG